MGTGRDFNKIIGHAPDSCEEAQRWHRKGRNKPPPSPKRRMRFMEAGVACPRTVACHSARNCLYFTCFLPHPRSPINTNPQPPPSPFNHPTATHHSPRKMNTQQPPLPFATRPRPRPRPLISFPSPSYPSSLHHPPSRTHSNSFHIMPPLNVLTALRAAKSDAQRNASLLDHFAAPHRAIAASNVTSSPSKTPPSPPSSMTPVSRRILSHIFAALDKPIPANTSSPYPPNYIFIDNDQEHHFLYALVLPLIARLLTVSCPGLVCIVQLPRADTTPHSAVSPTSYDGYGSNGSNGSKSAAPTTPSPHNTSRTPSPSDDHVAQTSRKSLTPDHNTPSHLIRHADTVLSRSASQPLSNFQHADSPPPELVTEHRALRLVCNGFEVLTGKMPPPRYDMAAFSLASISWDKAAIIEPEEPSKGVSLAFSNGMASPTDGIVVTFSNGSLAVLTLLEAIATLESANISDDTPVVLFSFSAPGRPAIADILARSESDLDAESKRIRAQLRRPNCLFVEFGYSGSPPSSETNAPIQEKTPVPTDIASIPPSERPMACPPLLMTAIPRAVPLFVNTINQAFVEGVSYDMPNGAYTHQQLKRCYPSQPPTTATSAPLRHTHTPDPVYFPRASASTTPPPPLSALHSAAQHTPAPPLPPSHSGSQQPRQTSMTEVHIPHVSQTTPCITSASPHYQRRWAPPHGSAGSPYDYYGYTYGGRGAVRPPPSHPGYYMPGQGGYYGYNGYYTNGWQHRDQGGHVHTPYASHRMASAHYAQQHGYYANDAYHGQHAHAPPSENAGMAPAARRSQRQPPPGGGQHDVAMQKQNGQAAKTTTASEGVGRGEDEMDKDALQGLLRIRRGGQIRSASSSSSSSSKRARRKR